MANTYDTSVYPLGSTEVEVLLNNASNLDDAVNGDATTWPDRFGQLRKSWRGIETDAQDALLNTGFEFIGDYVADGPLTLTRYNQTFSRSGEFWRPGPSITLPFTTTGNWAADGPNFVTNGDSSLRTALASSTGFSYVNYSGGAANEVPVSIEDLLINSVNIKRFGAACDGVTDDTAAVQAAVNYCATFADWPPLEVPGPCKLTASVIIDRLVDTTTSEFRIFGTGARAGFYATSNIKMFDSSIAMTVDPKSEFVTFQNLYFGANNISASPKVLSEKFLRVKLLNCYFKFVKLIESPSTYIQSIYLTNCNIRTWPGVFMFATHAFDVDLNGCISEFGNGYLCDFQNGCHSVRLRGGVHEGSVGGLISTGNVNTLQVGPYYLEGNQQKSLQFNAGSPNHSITVLSCFTSSTETNLLDTNFYEFEWGNTQNGVSIGNRNVNGRLHDNSLLPATTNAPRLFSQGDSAAIAVAKQPLYLDQASGSFALAATATSPVVNSATYRRNGNWCEAEISVTFSGLSGSPAQLTNFPYASSTSIFGGSVIYSDLAGEIVLIGGLSIGASATSVLICKNKQATPYTYTELNGKTLVGRIQCQV